MRLIILVLYTLVLSACSSMVNIDYDRSTNFKSFTTFSIQTKPVSVDDDTRVTTPFMRERIVNSINNELVKKGFKNKDKKGELNVKYHIDVKKDFESEGSTMSIGFGSAGRHSAIGMGFVFPVGETYSVDKFFLTIDIFSTKTEKLVWRGSLAYRLDVGATPETYTRMANELVVEILKEFPPK